jgi:acylphosphatase
MTICKRVYYSGRVQGVGFRYTAQKLASGFPVAGYVCNLSDGRVELVAEGDSADVAAFLATIAQKMATYIDQSSIQDEEPGGYRGFGIRH